MERGSGPTVREGLSRQETSSLAVSGYCPGATLVIGRWSFIFDISGLSFTMQRQLEER